MTDQAELFREIPEGTPKPDVYFVVAKYDGRGPMKGLWKIFPKIFLSGVAAQKFADQLSPNYKYRKVYHL